MKKEKVDNLHERYLFAGHEVIFQVVHQGTTVGIFDAINEFLNDPQVGDDNWRKRLELPNADSRIITFPSPSGEPVPDQPRPFSLIPVTILGHDPKDPTPDDVLNLLNEAYTELEGRFFEQGGGGPVILLQANEDGEKKAKTIDLGNGFELKSISPNWLASTLHHGGSTGGPGSMPARKPELEEDQHKFRLKGKQPPHISLLLHKSPVAEEGKVQVAILDTARPLSDFDAFPSKVRDMFIGVQVVPYLDPQELSNFDPYATWPHHYEMRDHGTFITSIVRAIASEAKIYLHEVLNSFGMGSLKSIAQGLADAASQPTPLVINCSFVLEDNLEELKEKLKDYTALLKLHIQALMKLPLQEVFTNMTSIPDVVVVAAAGNDNDSSPVNRPDPRFPAAYNKVLSVAALPKGNPRHPQSTAPESRKYKAAGYSNLAHAAGSSKEAYSFATFGGDLVHGSSRPSGGVLGVYIGGIPTQNPDGTFNPGPVNTTGWAQWSGTSFAAPIISALLATKESELECDNPNIPFSDPPDPARPYRTVDDENVILLRQGE